MTFYEIYPVKKYIQKLIQLAKEIILKNFVSMETAGSKQVVWKLLFFATFITLHISIDVYYLTQMIRIPCNC